MLWNGPGRTGRRSVGDAKRRHEEDRKAKEERGMEPRSMTMAKRDEARKRRYWQGLGTELTGGELLWRSKAKRNTHGIGSDVTGKELKRMSEERRRRDPRWNCTAQMGCAQALRKNQPIGSGRALTRTDEKRLCTAHQGRATRRNGFVTNGKAARGYSIAQTRSERR